MSDPVTNVQIEDVLSSIRRLVSADDRPETEEKETPAQAPDALVLTPSLRVSGDQKPDATEEHGKDDSPSDDVSAEQTDAAEPAEANWADSAPEQDIYDDRDEDDLHDTHDDIRLEETADADDGTPTPDDWSDEDQAAHEHDDHSDTAQDAWQHDVASEDEADEPSVDHGDANGDDHNAAQDDQKPDHRASDETGTSDHAEGDNPAQQDSQDDHASENLSARVAGFEEAIAARDDNWEPDGDSDDDNAAQPTQALPWQDDEPQSFDDVEDAELVAPNEGLEPFEMDEDDFNPQMVEDAVASAAANAFIDQEDPLGDDAAILDEEALRDLVTDIVREELQGALGERITRNVRKLVRREIHRALATQELE